MMSKSTQHWPSTFLSCGSQPGLIEGLFPPWSNALHLSLQNFSGFLVSPDASPAFRCSCWLSSDWCCLQACWECIPGLPPSHWWGHWIGQIPGEMAGASQVLPCSTEWFVLEGALKTVLFNSNLAWNNSRDGASISSLGNLFQRNASQLTISSSYPI